MPDERPEMAGPTGGVDAALWDGLAGNHFYSTSTWLKHCATYPGAVSGAVSV